MKILIVFATTEGQTAKVARFVLDRLVAAGHSAALLPAAEAGAVDPAGFDGAVVAGSVHAGHYQKDLVGWARAHAGPLGQVPTLFLSVSLGAAGDDAEDWAGLRACVDRFAAETGWTPARVEHVAGAFRFSEYDFFKSWAMRWIASRKDPGAPSGEDREYTDWEALEALVGDWTAGLGAGR